MSGCFSPISSYSGHCCYTSSAAYLYSSQQGRRHHNNSSLDLRPRLSPYLTSSPTLTDKQDRRTRKTCPPLCHDCCEGIMPRASTSNTGLAIPEGQERGGSGLEPREGKTTETLTTSFQQRFEFVQGLDSKAERKKTRSWVTTQHYRKKRFEDSLRTTEEGAPGSKDNGRQRSTQCRSFMFTEGLIRAKYDEESSLLQHLGSGRADPFNSYPVHATRDVHALVDHCAFTSLLLEQFPSNYVPLTATQTTL